MRILTVALQKDGELVPTSFELIEAAKSLGGEITTLILAENAQPLAEQLSSRGGGKVIAISNPALKYFNDEIYVNVISEIIKKYNPELVLGPATFYGKALFSRLAAKNGGKMASDINGLKLDNDTVVVSRPNFGGSVISDIVKNGEGSFFATLRPKNIPESQDGDGEVITEEISATAFESKTEIKEMKVESTGAVNLTEADIVVSAGRGLKEASNLTLVKDLADSLKAAFGASRAIVDAGWTEYSNQVGQTGKTVNPKLYIAVGISGAIQHLVGMRSSQTIVAINKDKDAPIFNVSNYGIVGDALEIVPALTAKLKKELS